MKYPFKLILIKKANYCNEIHVEKNLVKYTRLDYKLKKSSNSVVKPVNFEINTYVPLDIIELILWKLDIFTFDIIEYKDVELSTFKDILFFYHKITMWFFYVLLFVFFFWDFWMYRFL